MIKQTIAALLLTTVVANAGDTKTFNCQTSKHDYFGTTIKVTETRSERGREVYGCLKTEYSTNFYATIKVGSKLHRNKLIRAYRPGCNTRGKDVWGHQNWKSSSTDHWSITIEKTDDFISRFSPNTSKVTYKYRSFDRDKGYTWDYTTKHCSKK